MVPVKTFTSAAEMQEHYKALHARLFQAKPSPVVLPPASKPAKEFSVDHLPPGLQAKANARNIVAKVAERHGITVEDMYGKSRKSAFAVARWEAVDLVSKANPTWTLHQLGHFFNRDHTTIIHALKMVAKRRATSE